MVENPLKSSIIPEIVSEIALGNREPDPIITLTLDETQLRKALEAQITQGLHLLMQGFYQVGCALRQLKALKLHRDTHQRFDEYAKERFRISKRYQHYLINAVEVIDALKEDEQYFKQIQRRLPEREFHCRELLKLGNQPPIWKKAWALSLIEAGGQIPTASTVRNVVRQLKNLSAEQNPFQVGDICLIEAGDNLELFGLHGCWAIIVKRNEHYCDIQTSLGLKKKIPSQYLLPSAYSEQQQQQILLISRLLDLIPSSVRKEEAVIALLKIYGKRFVLSDVEADLLTTLLSIK